MTFLSKKKPEDYKFEDPNLPDGWDWESEMYFMLMPFLGGPMRWEDYQDFPIRRAFQFIERINVLAQDKSQVISLRELEIGRNLGRLFGSSDQS